MSMLGEKIHVLKTDAIRIHAPKLVKHYMTFAKDCGEFGQNLQTITAYLHPEDSADLWESMCIVMDTLTREQIAEDIGLVIVLKGASEAQLKWSGQ